MRAKIINVMSIIFKIDENEINDNSSIENIQSWDSLKHINFIISLEEKLNLEFSSDEIVKMISLKKILDIIKSK